MNNFLIFLIFIFSTGAIGALIYLIKIIYEVKDLPIDEVQVEIYGLLPWTENHARGRLINILRGPKRSIVEFMPYISNEKRKKGITVKLVKVPVLNSNMIFFSKGELDDDFNYLHLYAPSSDLLPDKFKDSKLGIAMSNVIESNNHNNLQDTIDKSRQNVVDKALMKTTGLEAINDYIDDDANLNRLIKKKLSNSKEVGGAGAMFGGTK